MKKTFCIILTALVCALSYATPVPSLIIKEKPKEKYKNPCAQVMNNTLRGILGNPAHRCFGNATYRNWRDFFDWAVWGYLSGDSEFQGDERLPKLIAEWMDYHLKLWVTPPENPAQKAKWKPNSLELWTFHAFAFPLAEVKSEPELAKKIGTERLAKYEKVVMDNLRESRERFRERLKENRYYLNMVHHTVPQMVAGYMLTGDRAYLDECEPALEEQLKQLMPNGSFPYRLKIFGPNHYETDFGYYHAIDVRAAYLLWVLGQSSRAREMLKRSASYYPLNIEPGGHTNDGPTIWWKDQWRNWWPHHIAMVALTAEDGENSKMAQQYGAMDYFDNVIGAHAFRKLAEKKIVPKQQRTDYFISDPDIRGWRSRFSLPDGGTFSSTLTTAPNSYTKASSMIVNDKKMTALHHARMAFRRKPIALKPKMFDPDIFNVTSHNGIAASAESRIGNVAAIGISDNIALCGETWRKTGQSLWDGKHYELWLVLPHGMAGLLVSSLEKDRRGAEFSHEYKMIAQNIEWKNDSAKIDGMAHLQIWQHNFPNKIQERVRRYVYDTSNRRPDFQLVLSDQSRDPEEKIQSGDRSAQNLKMKNYTAGTTFFSLASFTPETEQFRKITLLSQKTMISFLVITKNGTRWLAAYNPTGTAMDFEFENMKYQVEGGKTLLKQLSN